MLNVRVNMVLFQPINMSNWYNGNILVEEYNLSNKHVKLIKWVIRVIPSDT